MRVVVAILLFLIALNCVGQFQRIPLTAGIAYANQHQKDDLNKLTDGDVTTQYTVWSPKITPYKITYDLSDYDNVSIYQIRFYVPNGNPSQLKFYARKANGDEVLLYSYSGGGWIQDYQIINVSSIVEAKDFVIESPGGSDFPSEIQIYGTYTIHQTQFTQSTPSPLSDLMGVVVKPWDIASDYMFPEKLPATKELGATRVRLYDDYQLNHDENGNLIFDNNLWHQTANIKLLKDNGISTQQCYLATPYYPFTGDKLNPETYLQLAKDVYAFGVHNKANGDQVKTFEVENELNRWYGNFETEYMDGYQLACMMSVCYDGHKGKYPNVGLKASGSQALLSIPGLAEGEPYIFYQMIDWCIKNRGYRADGSVDFPFDVYSFHCYPSLEGQREYNIPGTIPPEYGAAPYFARLNKLRNQYAPWLKIHVGEWSGGDVSPNSPLAAPVFGKYNADQSSAMFSVRMLLLMAENYINASSFYRIKSDYDALDYGSWIIFANMRLLLFSGNAVKQPDGSYLGMIINRTLTGDYFKQMSALFAEGWVFDSRVSDSPLVLKFKKGTKELYPVWNPESMIVTDRPYLTEKESKFSITKNGTVKRLADDGSGVMTSAPYYAGTSLTANSKPFFVVVDNSVAQSPLPLKLISFTAEKVNKAVVLKWIVQDAAKVEVERSFDTRNWTNLGEGIFNKLVDMQPLSGKNYYRLKMYEADGSFTYSNVKVVNFNGFHSKLSVYNVAGQKVKEGWSEDEQRFKSELPKNSIFYFRYNDSFTETFLKQ